MTSPLEPIKIAGLDLRTRVMRSATAERMADLVTGEPAPQMAEMYRALAAGNVGLIVTGHAFIEKQGRAHPRMSGIDSDQLIAPWRTTIRPAQQLGAKVMLQINHCGASTDSSVNPDPISPSGVATNERSAPRAMSVEDIERIIAAFGQAARRARDAGFDGVQLHGAHGYLVTQFLSASTNLRDDAWGGETVQDRMRFLDRIVAEVRAQVGSDYPVWIKLGVAGRHDSGLDISQGALVAKHCSDRGIDCIEISHALGDPAENTCLGEANYWTMAQAVRAQLAEDYPLALVSGFRSLDGMARALCGSTIQLISMCRPLIAQPTLLNDMAAGSDGQAVCVRCGQCWPKEPGGFVDCHNKAVRRRLGRS